MTLTVVMHITPFPSYFLHLFLGCPKAFTCQLRYIILPASLGLPQGLFPFVIFKCYFSTFIVLSQLCPFWQLIKLTLHLPHHWNADFTYPIHTYVRESSANLLKILFRDANLFLVHDVSVFLHSALNMNEKRVIYKVEKWHLHNTLFLRNE